MSRRLDIAVLAFLAFGLAAAIAVAASRVELLTETAVALSWLASMAVGVWLLRFGGDGIAAAVLSLLALVAGSILPLALVADGQGSSLALWLFVAALCCLAWRVLGLFGGLEDRLGGRLGNFIVPGLYGLWTVFLWQVVTTGLGIPVVLLPPPSAIYAAIAQSELLLWHDFFQTFIRSVLPGFAIGCSAGFIVAVLADRFAFLERGLLPIGNLASALPIVGVAPIMVMWFGFDWQSKAAVVVIMTFFPMLVNTIAGLKATDRTERDLMRSYGATGMQTLVRVQLPNAAPFIFNALKINSTLALIGAIVAEFFGTPIVGMGFRISAEVGRMNIAMVWATIAVAAVAGSAFYGALALCERRVTFWHPSHHHHTD